MYLMKVIPETLRAHEVIYLIFVTQFYKIVYNIPGLGLTQSSSILPSPSSSVSRVIINKKDLLVDIHETEAVKK